MDPAVDLFRPLLTVIDRYKHELINDNVEHVVAEMCEILHAYEKESGATVKR